MAVPASRPDDFLAEMVKADAQMLKVRGRIAEEQKRVKVVDERRRNQANAKFGKALGTKRQQERAKKKTETLKDIANWKYCTYD